MRRFEGTIKDCEVLVFEVWSSFDRLVFVDVSDNFLRLSFGIAKRLQCQRNRLIDDLHHAAASELLVLDQSNVRLDAGRVAVHHESDGSGRSQYGRLSIAIAVSASGLKTLVPHLTGCCSEILRTFRVDLVCSGTVHFHDFEHRLFVLPIPGEGTKIAGDLAGSTIAFATQKSRQSTTDALPRFAVIRNSHRHQQAAEICKSQPKRTEAVRILSDRRRWIAGVVDQNFLSRDEDAGRSAKPSNVECAIFLLELPQVDARQIAGRIVKEHVLGARVRGVDRT